jgi:hypothetical protein
MAGHFNNDIMAYFSLRDIDCLPDSFCAGVTKLTFEEDETY